MATISLKTVYQTLNDLAELGEIAALDVGTGRTRFDPNVDDPTTTWSAGAAAACATSSSTSRAVRPRRSRPGLRARQRRGHLPRPVPDVPDCARRPGSDRAPASRPTRRSDRPPAPNTDQKGTPCPTLKDSKTEANLKEAFAGESQANRRYLYFAQKADVEGYPDVAALFRSVAEGETGHAFGHFDFLARGRRPGDRCRRRPDRGQPQVGHRGRDLRVLGDVPGLRPTARDEGFDEIAEWFETLARAEKSHAGRFTEGLDVRRLTASPRPVARATPAPAPVPTVDAWPHDPATSRTDDRHDHDLRPDDPAYLDEADLRVELERVFDLCHGCRLCFNLCPSFPTLFDLVDAHDGDVSATDAAEQDRVVDECYQCKLCYPKCPYVPPHEWQLDFPRLMMRAHAVRHADGLPVRERVTDQVLARTDLLGRVVDRGGAGGQRRSPARPGRWPAGSWRRRRAWPSERLLPPVRPDPLLAPGSAGGTRAAGRRPFVHRCPPG